MENITEMSLKISKAINELGVLTVNSGVLTAMCIVMFTYIVFDKRRQAKQMETLTKFVEICMSYLN